MNLSGKQLIPAPRAIVWEGLNDPELLRQSIPGCQSMEKRADDCFAAIVAIKVGPIGARMTGDIAIADLNPMSSYSLVCNGDGGGAGFVKSVIKVSLEDEGDSTNLSYEVDAQINGKLAQLGGAVIEATAKRLAAMFFKKFSAVLVASTVPPADSADNQSTQPVAAGQSDAAGKAGSISTVTTPAVPASASFPLGWVVALLIAELVGYVAGSAGSGVGLSGWFGLSLVLLISLVACVAYGLGRRAASSVVIMDEALLERLSGFQAEKKP